MSARVYESIAAGAVQGHWAQVLAKMAQRRRIVRFCQFKGIDCVPTSVICNNYRQDLDKACMLYRMGYADAVIIASMRGWSAEEKGYFSEMIADSKIKIINLDELNGRHLLD